MATASEQRNQAVAYMKSRTKKNTYTNGGKRTYFFGYPDNEPGNTSQKGYSDCSAAVRKAIMAATGVDIGSNTHAQVNNRNKKGIVVHETSGIYPDESKLLPGDCLYFKGNTSHTLDVGHVEMYTGPNECYGHGSGTGPTKKDLKAYCKNRGSKQKRYFMAIRWITDGTETPSSPADTEPVALQKGMYNNSAVKAMQQNLIALGYLEKGEADGDFGPKTEKALKEFQKAAGIAVDGSYGPESRAAMEKVLKRKVKIVNGNCNVRPEPNTGGKPLGVAKRGETYDYLGSKSENGWHLIDFKGEQGWVSGKYSKLEA